MKGMNGPGAEESTGSEGVSAAIEIRRRARGEERYCLLQKCNWLRLVPHLGLYKSRGAPS